MKPRLLDLFCGAGGAAVGYARAGFDVVGVDIAWQKSYPFTFERADALAFPLAGFDAIHASPPCKAFTVARKVHATIRPTLFEPHADLLAPIRDRLAASGLLYVIENVPGAPLIRPRTLCGSMFAETMRVRRHRLFETNWRLSVPACRHYRQRGGVVGVYGDGGAWDRQAAGGGGRKVAGAEAAEVLGIDWTTRQPDLAQAIPPAYTEYIGARLLLALQR